MTLRAKILLLSACAFGIAAFLALPGDTSESSTIGFGANPELAFPHTPLIPTLNIAPARPWTGNEMPVAKLLTVFPLAGLRMWIHPPQKSAKK